MATHLAVRNKKQAITREREHYSEIAKLKTFRVHLSSKFILSHERHTLAHTHTQADRQADRQTDRQTDNSNSRVYARRALISCIYFQSVHIIRTCTLCTWNNIIIKQQKTYHQYTLAIVIASVYYSSA